GMITGLSPNKRPYILKSDRESKNPTVFQLRSISKARMSEIQKLQPKHISEDANKMTDIYLAEGVLGWTTFPDQEGVDIPFSIPNIEKLMLYASNELFTEITGAVAPEQEKNSERQSLSPNGSATETPTSGTASSASLKDLTNSAMVEESIPTQR
ncbi:MAG: hypothetical protein Q8O19_01270, partial [Rectinemataceae bacterium]|nr:hypothetical protein [Rectinemataceae bacterium]